MEFFTHRPWPPPAAPHTMVQRWHDLLFAHWPLPAEDVRRAVPAELELDLFEGRAWVGVIPFRMSGIHLRGLPAIPGTAAFEELNVRTYVVYGGKPGVWFFSLDAASRLAVEVARRWFWLPYFSARINCAAEGGGIHYTSRRTDGRGATAELAMRYRPTGEIVRAAPGSLDHWLTERYCLYVLDSRRRVLRAEIHHAPWPLQPAKAEIEVNTMAAAAGLRLPPAQPVLHFARQLEVTVWAPRPAGTLTTF